MDERGDMPFKAEYAKSGRAGCKRCKDTIAKDSLRLAIMVQSPMFDGKVPNWFHEKCFWGRAKVSDTSEIHGFDSLRWDDQQKLKGKVGGGGASGSGGGGAGDTGGSYNDFAVEYAKSNRSTCRGCDDKIEKDAVRISRKDYESERAKMYGPQDLWHHVDCFAEKRDDLEFSTDMQPDKIKGFKILKKDDKSAVIEALGKGVKRKAAPASKEGAKKAKTSETPEQKAMREQSQLIWSFRDKLQKEVSNEAMKILLQYNKQDVPSGESKLLDRVSDCLAFGALKPCEECGGQMVYSGTGGKYFCTGNMTEWTKCMNSTREPKRKAFKVPEQFHDVDFLKKHKFVKRDRILPPETANGTSGMVTSSSGGATPLAGMKFVIGKTSGSKADLTKKIKELGGEVATKVDKKVAAYISTKGEVEKNSKMVKDAKAADVHVIDEEFLNACKKGGAALLITQHSLCSWGSDPSHRVSDVVDGPVKKSGAFKSGVSARDEKMFTKSVPSKMKMKLKGGGAVDPDSGLEDQAHVLKEGDLLYNAVLGMVDIVRGTNSYYKLQILESDKGSRWWVFRAWGRVGTTIGGNKLETCGSRNSCLLKFKELYADKTGNDWEDRDNFKKIPNKFYPLDIDYGGDEESVKFDVNAPSTSTLAKPVQDLIKMIFDVESMKKAMVEFEIDLKKMPLGKLSRKQIESAYKVLKELSELIEKGGTQTQLLDGSNRFYTLIPHDFGMKKPPLLDTLEVIKTKSEMLDNLLEIELAYSLMKSDDGSSKDPIDAHYEKLKTDVKVVDKKTEEFEMLEKYVANTHAPTHTHYQLEVQEIYKVARQGESKRYKPFKSLHNRMLLWHGSRMTNWVGILSQGLRIAPPEAPVTGYMFGKGVYFADMVTKSANYCAASKTNPVQFLMLCEVALGNMYELKNAKFVDKLPKGMHSTKGLGMTGPDPADNQVTADGVVVPLGKGMSTDTGSSSLLYNEYIVYDVSQINVKYMLKCKYNFKW